MKSLLTGIIILLVVIHTFAQTVSNVTLPFYPNDNFFNKPHFISAAKDMATQEISLTIFNGRAKSYSFVVFNP